MQSTGVIGQRQALRGQQPGGRRRPARPARRSAARWSGHPPDASTPGSTSARCARSTCRSSRRPSRRAASARSCAPTRASTASTRARTTHLLDDILKGDWDFKGFVLTDYGANKNTVDSLNNGLDLDIFPARLLPAAARRRRARLEPGQPGDGRRARAPPAAHAVRVRLLRPRRLRRRRHDDRPGTPTTRRRARSSSRASCCCKNDDGMLPLDAAQGRQGRRHRPGGRRDQERRRLVGDRRVQDHDAARPRCETRARRDRVVYDDGSDAAARGQRREGRGHRRSSSSATR